MSSELRSPHCACVLTAGVRCKTALPGWWCCALPTTGAVCNVPYIVSLLGATIGYTHRVGQVVQALLTAKAPRRSNAAVKLGVVAAVQRSSLAPAVQMVPLSTPADEAARPNNRFAADAGATTHGLPVACADGVVGSVTVHPQPSVGSSNSSSSSVGGDGGGIVLQDLGCDSPAGQPLFRRLSFTLTAGCNVLVMGSTGSGKVRTLVSPRCMAIVLRPPSLPSPSLPP